MLGAQNGAVANIRRKRFAQRGNGTKEIIRRNFAKYGLAKVLRHQPHFPGNCGVAMGQIVVAPAGVDHNNGKSLGGKIVGNVFD